MYPHRIRLRGPWQCEPLARAGRVRWRRRFGYPGRIDPHERVWLTLAGIEGHADIMLNGETLGTKAGQASSVEFDVTTMLQPRNELIIDIEDPASRGGQNGEVAMEIRCLAWLKDVRVRMVREDGSARLEVEGKAIGTAERPLELYVVLGRSPLLYEVLEPGPEGTPFRLRSEPLDIERSGVNEFPVRVELVNGATAWCTFDTLVSLI